MYKNTIIRVVVFSLLLAIGVGLFGYAQTEELTVTTFYPSPYGVYQILNLFPTDTIDPSAACSNSGELFYDKSEDELYLCVAGQCFGRYL